MTTAGAARATENESFGFGQFILDSIARDVSAGVIGSTDLFGPISIGDLLEW